MSPLLMLFPALRRRFGGIGPYARMLGSATAWTR